MEKWVALFVFWAYIRLYEEYILLLNSGRNLCWYHCAFCRISMVAWLTVCGDVTEVGLFHTVSLLPYFGELRAGFEYVFVPYTVICTVLALLSNHSVISELF